jgi:hypothetical protein
MSMEALEITGHIVLIIGVIMGCVWMNNRMRMANFSTPMAISIKKEKV